MCASLLYGFGQQWGLRLSSNFVDDALCAFYNFHTLDTHVSVSETSRYLLQKLLRLTLFQCEEDYKLWRISNKWKHDRIAEHWGINILTHLRRSIPYLSVPTDIAAPLSLVFLSLLTAQPTLQSQQPHTHVKRIHIATMPSGQGGEFVVDSRYGFY